MGQALAEELSSKFYDGDDFHSEENKEKMRSGSALTDRDRLPWLESLSSLLAREEGCVVACSALKKSYRLVARCLSSQYNIKLSREILSPSGAGVVFVYLKGSKQMIEDRLLSRENHYFKASMIQTQFHALEVAQFLSEEVFLPCLCRNPLS